MQILRVVKVLQQLVEGFILLGLDIRHFNVGFGAPVTMTTVIVEHTAPQTVVGGFLIILEDRRIDPQAAGVDVFRETFSRHLACHFGDEFGMHRIFVGLTLDDQRLFQGSFVLPGINKSKFIHTAQNILLA
jgi:hypothetical protein